MTESRFASTRWNLVQLAGGENSPEGRAALEELCSRYWYPLYAFLRRSGRAPEEAADLVQGLFTSLIERESLGGADRDLGRFRSWLLGALNHHVADVYKHKQALKRGGGHAIVSIDVDLAEIDEKEGQHRAGEAEEGEPQPGSQIAWQPHAARDQDADENHAGEGDAPGNDGRGRQVVEGDFREHEGAAPQGGQHGQVEDVAWARWCRHARRAAARGRAHGRCFGAFGHGLYATYL